MFAINKITMAINNKKVPVMAAVILPALVMCYFLTSSLACPKDSFSQTKKEDDRAS
ncbi:Uncharacterised protein [Salmonella enterica subsp. enterica]|nr:Uncharacterised protein [Salmonella enterica subsp. enterica] [Salmonella enterica subsp. enterica serovar Menston]